jgi:hypothetical protein
MQEIQPPVMTERVRVEVTRVQCATCPFRFSTDEEENAVAALNSVWVCHSSRAYGCKGFAELCL